MHSKVWNASLVVYQKRVVIWANRALKSFVTVPVPSGFEAKSNALNLASSNCSACSQKRNTLYATKTKNRSNKKRICSFRIVLREIKGHISSLSHNTSDINTWTQTSATSALAIVLVSVCRSSSSFPISNSRIPPSLSCRPPALYHKKDARIRFQKWHIVDMSHKINVNDGN